MRSLNQRTFRQRLVRIALKPLWECAVRFRTAECISEHQWII